MRARLPSEQLGDKALVDEEWQDARPLRQLLVPRRAALRISAISASTTSYRGFGRAIEDFLDATRGSIPLRREDDATTPKGSTQ
jgi:hypothetical protein